MWAFGSITREHPLSEQQIVKLADLTFMSTPAEF
jgi:hypothetical protein